MSAMVQELSGKISAYVRDSGREVTQDELIDAFPRVPVAQVRLIAQDLRKRDILRGRVEDGKVSYTWIPRAEKDKPPLRQPNTTLPAAKSDTAPLGEQRAVVNADYVLKVMREHDGNRHWRRGELHGLMPGISEESVKRLLEKMVKAGRIFAHGVRAGCRYSLHPSGLAPVKKDDLKDVPPAQIAELSAGARSLTEPVIGKFPAAAYEALRAADKAIARELGEAPMGVAIRIPTLAEALLGEPTPEPERVPANEEAFERVLWQMQQAMERLRALGVKDNVIEQAFEDAPALAQPKRRFAWWSDGFLAIECERCSGELSRDDLAALSEFVHQIPKVANV